MSNNVEKEFEIYILRKNRREISNRFYITKNMYQRIMDIAMSNFFTLGYVNMNVIKTILNMFKEEFDCYPQKIKDTIGSDFKDTVVNLSNENYIMENITKIKKIKYKK